MRVKKRREMEDTGETRAHGGGGAKRFEAKSNEDALGLITERKMLGVIRQFFVLADGL
jgi:hypothetical protein